MSVRVTSSLTSENATRCLDEGGQQCNYLSWQQTNNIKYSIHIVSLHPPHNGVSWDEVLICETQLEIAGWTWGHLEDPQWICVDAIDSPPTQEKEEEINYIVLINQIQVQNDS